MGSRTWSIECCHFQRPWMTAYQDFEGTPLFDVECVRNDISIYTRGCYRPLTERDRWPTELCYRQWPWLIFKGSSSCFCLTISVAYCDRKSRQSNEWWRCRWPSVTFEGHFSNISVFIVFISKYSTVKYNKCTCLELKECECWKIRWRLLRWMSQQCRCNRTPPQTSSSRHSFTSKTGRLQINNFLIRYI